MNALFLALLLGGSTPCSSSPPPPAAASPAGEKAGKPQPTPKPCPAKPANVPEVDAVVEGVSSMIGASDTAVVLAALLDLLTFNGKDSPIGGFGPKEPLWFDRKPERATTPPGPPSRHSIRRAGSG